ncbi:MAG: SAM-dependent methyltransferase, partial [Bacilli bacterium]|nr:SAM-dependent methyltransferase [Bacilli bacterium]
MVGKSETIESKNLRGLVEKIEKYIEFLKENEEFDTEFLKLGDGISVSKRHESK